MQRGIAAALVTLGTACLAPAARADVSLGVLTCTLDEGSVASAAPSSRQGARDHERDALCTFQAKGGAEETYVGKFQGVSPSPGRNRALMWVVRSAADVPARPGLLAQRYAADPTKPADPSSPIIGEVHPEIALQTMADALPSAASASENPPPKGFVVIGVELALTASAC